MGKLDNNSKVNLVFILADIIEQYMLEVEPLVKQEFKQDVKAISTRCKRLIKFADKCLCVEGQEQFGDTADQLRLVIENEYLKDETTK